MPDTWKKIVASPLLGALLAPLTLFAIPPAVSAPAGTAKHARPHDLSPCALLQRSDVTRLTTWQVNAVERKRYDLNGAEGTMCFFESTQGSVIVIVPDRGSPFPGDSPFADPQDEGIVRRDRASGVSVTYYNGTAYMNVGRRDLAVRVVPDSHIASYYEVEPFAELLIPRARI
jgi:hypothetical protein